MKNFVKDWLIKLFSAQARKIIKKHKPIVIGIVGSVGKTSTKYAIATVLSKKYRVQYQKGNYNVPLTMPLVVTGQSLPSLSNPFGWLKVWLAGQKYVHGKYPYDVVVLEMGTDTPGDIAELAQIIKPDIAVVTGVSEEHMEYFKTLDNVAKEELSIAQFAKQLVINNDDTNSDAVKLYVPNDLPITKYGFSRGSHYKLQAQRSTHHSFALEVVGPTGQDIKTDVMVAAKHSLLPVGAAITVAEILGMSKANIEKGVSSVLPPSGRMRLLEGQKGSLIIDDSYNSSPIAAEAALKTLFEMKAPQKIAILGNMNELGAVSKTAHQHIGDMLRPDKVDLVITLGLDANKYLATSAEQNSCSVIRTTDPYKAGKVALQNLSEKAIILIKGSQGDVFLEEAVKMLLANPNDAKHLVRQNDFWQTKKSNLYNNLEQS